MRALLQRVVRAAVSIDSQVVGSIERGLVVLVGIAANDSEANALYLVEKLVNLRIFPDAEGHLNLSALETRAELLLVSQFTLYAETRKGRRPGFTEAAPPAVAAPLFARFVELCKASGLKVESGRFQEHMLVEIHNDGPVTILLDSTDRLRPRNA